MVLLCSLNVMPSRAAIASAETADDNVLFNNNNNQLKKSSNSQIVNKTSKYYNSTNSNGKPNSMQHGTDDANAAAAAALQLVLSDYSEAFAQLPSNGYKNQNNNNNTSKKNYNLNSSSNSKNQISNADDIAIAAVLKANMWNVNEKSSDSSNSNVISDSNFNLHKELLDSFRGTYHEPNQPMYTNDFAVHIPAGSDIADLIAQRYGFTNMGQVSLLASVCF